MSNSPAALKLLRNLARSDAIVRWRNSGVPLSDARPHYNWHMKTRCLLFCVAAGLLIAQEPAPTIKVSSRLIEVTVVVHDRKGDPVTDLTRDDFTIYDKGQKQQIRYFSKEGDDPPPESVPVMDNGAVSNRFITVNADGKTRVQPLPDSLTVILLDGLNTRFTNQVEAKEALIKFLKQLRTGDRVAIYTLTNDLHILCDFTSDISKLLADLEGRPAQESAAMAASSYVDAHTGKAEFDAVINKANAEVAAYALERRTQITFLALRSIANHLAGFPGRKNLIWLSGGFPPALGAIKALSPYNDVDIAIYPVDARGLMGMTDWMPSMHAASSLPLSPRGKSMDERAENDNNWSLAAMTALAAHTGGEAFINNNDIAGGIRRAVDDARVTYVLYYAPSHNEWNGEFRDIKIKVDRPGLEARNRSGYYAMPDPPSDKQSRRNLLAEAETNPLGATGLTIVARLLDHTLTIALDGHEITFAPNSKGQPDATVDMRMLAFGDQPKPLSETGHTGHLVVEPEKFDQLMKDGVRLTLNVSLPAKSQRLRLVVRDVASGRVGSVDVPVGPSAH